MSGYTIGLTDDDIKRAASRITEGLRSSGIDEATREEIEEATRRWLDQEIGRLALGACFHALGPSPLGDFHTILTDVRLGWESEVAS